MPNATIIGITLSIVLLLLSHTFAQLKQAEEHAINAEYRLRQACEQAPNLTACRQYREDLERTTVAID